MLHALKKQMASARIHDELWDMSTHILSRVDDGAVCHDESYDMILKLREMGFKGIYCTPHVSSLYPENTRDFLESRFASLMEFLNDQNLGGIDIKLSALYLLDDSFLDVLGRGNLFTVGDNRVLIEFHQLSLKPNWREMLAALKSEGYAPVLVHPEKYINTFTCEDLVSLHSEGVEFQLNLFSLLDIYGREIRKRAMLLLKKGYYSDFGTGCHRDSQLKKLRLARLSELIKRN